MENKILIADGNPAVIKGYEVLFTKNQILFKIIAVHNCSEAYRKITEPGSHYHLAILDAALLPCNKLKLYSGLDVSTLLRKHQPHCKIMLLTDSSPDFDYYRIICRISPECLMVKGYFDIAILCQAIFSIYTGERYFCDKVKNAILTIANRNRNIYMDSINVDIISLLAKGIKTKNLPQHLNLSMSAIDKRKAQIKEIFDIAKGTDEDIIREAKNNGFI